MFRFTLITEILSYSECHETYQTPLGLRVPTITLVLAGGWGGVGFTNALSILCTHLATITIMHAEHTITVAFAKVIALSKLQLHVRKGNV